MKGLILAAGKGTRLRPITFSVPKPLIPIANKPTILYAIESFVKAGVKEIGIVVNSEYKKEFKTTIDKYITDNDIKIEYITQPHPKGIAHAVKYAEEFINKDNFVLQLGDNIIIHDYSKFIKTNSKCKILLSPVEDITRFGIAEFEGEKIVNLVEKPQISNSNLAMIGLYVFSNEVFKIIDKLEPSARGEYEITDAIRNMMNSFGSLDYETIDVWWKDTGTIEDMIEANKFVLKNKSIVDSTSFTDGCNIFNNVSIGKHCEIKNCSIVNSIIFDNVKLTNVNLENSIIANNCIIENLSGSKLPISVVLGSQSITKII